MAAHTAVVEECASVTHCAPCGLMLLLNGALPETLARLTTTLHDHAQMCGGRMGGGALGKKSSTLAIATLSA